MKHSTLPPGRQSNPTRLEFEVPRGLLTRLRLACLLQHFPQRPVWAVFMFINGLLTIAILAVVAMVSQVPFVFPSLGPTAFLFFFMPLAPTASPRNILCGHAIGILCGYGALWVTGLQDAPPVSTAGVDAARVLAAALSLAATGAFMFLARAAHPPAGATTLIISLGIVTRPLHLVILEAAVVLMVLQAIALTRLAGIDYLLWSSRSLPLPPGVLAPPVDGIADKIAGYSLDRSCLGG